MNKRIYQVDAFTNQPFSGNPAGVCILDGAADETWMQSVASEMNLAETAFLHPEQDGYRLRWFTPTNEMKLCGHATLASAHILFSEKLVSSERVINFYTKSGILTAGNKEGWIELDFPAIRTKAAATPAYLQQALSCDIKKVVANPGGFLIAEVENESIVRAIEPDFTLLKKVEGEIIIVTAKAINSSYDFASRVFVPKHGIDEDPVTGAAHCALAPYWGEKLGKNNFNAFQASRRGGYLRLIWKEDRVKLIGQAVTVLVCELIVHS